MADEKTEGSVRYDDVTGRKSDILAAIEAVGVRDEPVAPIKTEGVQPNAKLGEQDAPIVEPDSTQEPIIEPEQGTEQAPQEPKGIEPPQNWKKADKEAFAALPDEAKALLNKFESERTASYTKKTMEIADFRKEYGAVDEMFTPYKERMRSSGYTPYQMIQAWMNTERALMDGRGPDVVREIAKAYNIDLRSLVGAPAETILAAKRPEDMTPEERSAVEVEGILKPYLTPLQKQLEEATSKLTAFERIQQDNVQREQMSAVQRAQNQIASFAQEADAKTGESLRPHFKAVEDQMGYLALAYKNAGRQVPPLQDLYETACLSNPEIRQQMEAARIASDLKSAREAARAKATSATKAARSVTGSPGLNAPRANGHDNGQVSIRASLESAFENLRDT